MLKTRKEHGSLLEAQPLCQRGPFPHWISSSLTGGAWTQLQHKTQHQWSHQTTSQGPGEVGHRRSGRRMLESLKLQRTIHISRADCMWQKAPVCTGEPSMLMRWAWLAGSMCRSRITWNLLRAGRLNFEAAIFKFCTNTGCAWLFHYTSTPSVHHDYHRHSAHDFHPSPTPTAFASPCSVYMLAWLPHELFLNLFCSFPTFSHTRD